MNGENRIVRTADTARYPALLAAVAGAGDWTVQGLALDGDNRLVMRLARTGVGDSIDLVVRRGRVEASNFKILEHCSVGYIGNIYGFEAKERRIVLKLMLGLGQGIDGGLAEDPDMSIAELMGRRSEHRQLLFTRDGLRALLAPEIVQGIPTAGGWALSDVYPSSHLQESDREEMELILDFRRASDAKRALFIVGPRDDKNPAFLRTEHFNLSHLSFGVGGGGDDDLSLLKVLLSFILQLKDHKELVIEFPTPDVDVAVALLPSTASEADLGGVELPSNAVLNLAIDADCQQDCSFCSIKELRPPRDGGDTVLARCLADLQSNRRQGVTRVRINGYDPLGYSRIIEVLQATQELGYEHADVYSPCTRLADRAFCQQVVDALPDNKRFHIPIYGADPAIHDEVVGTPGSHTLLMQAIDNLLDMVGPEGIDLATVVTVQNISQLLPIYRWAQSKGVGSNIHMPFPSFEGKHDRFFDISPRQSDVIDAYFVDDTTREPGMLLPRGVAPCVLFRRMRKAGVPPKEWLDAPAKQPTLPGTDYRDPRYRHRSTQAGHSAQVAPTVTCPHAEICVLKTACAAEFLRAYIEKHGSDEFMPVTLREFVNEC